MCLPARGKHFRPGLFIQGVTLLSLAEPACTFLGWKGKTSLRNVAPGAGTRAGKVLLSQVSKAAPLLLVPQSRNGLRAPKPRPSKVGKGLARIAGTQNEPNDNLLISPG